MNSLSDVLRLLAELPGEGGGSWRLTPDGRIRFYHTRFHRSICVIEAAYYARKGYFLQAPLAARELGLSSSLKARIILAADHYPFRRWWRSFDGWGHALIRFRLLRVTGTL